MLERWIDIDNFKNEYAVYINHILPKVKSIQQIKDSQSTNYTIKLKTGGDLSRFTFSQVNSYQNVNM